MRNRALERRALLGLGAGCVLLPWLAQSMSLRGATPQRSLGGAVDLVRALSDSMRGVALTWMAEHPPAELAWDWGEGVLAFGMECAFHTTGDARLKTYLREYLRHHRTRGVAVTWSDRATPGLTATALAQQGEAEFAPLSEQVVRYVLGAPRTRSGMLRHLGAAYPDVIQRLFPDAWIDSVFHVVPTLMRYAVWKSDPRAFAEGARQLLLFSRALTDPVTGLVTHACNDGAALEPVPAFAQRVFWARGNGWMLAALVDALGYLPAGHPDRVELVTIARRLESRLGQAQASTGLFHTLLLDQDSYQETAGSALILFGMARGVRLGLFGDETLARVVRGARGLWQIVRRAGAEELVTGTSLGTNPVEGLYRWTPTSEQVSYGVGAWLLAASEAVLLFESASGVDA